MGCLTPWGGLGGGDNSILMFQRERGWQSRHPAVENPPLHVPPNLRASVLSLALQLPLPPLCPTPLLTALLHSPPHSPFRGACRPEGKRG